MKAQQTSSQTENGFSNTLNRLASTLILAINSNLRLLDDQTTSNLSLLRKKLVFIVFNQIAQLKLIAAKVSNFVYCSKTQQNGMKILAVCTTPVQHNINSKKDGIHHVVLTTTCYWSCRLHIYCGCYGEKQKQVSKERKEIYVGMA